MIWRQYVAAIKAIAALIAPYGAQWILDPRQARRALFAAMLASGLSVSPLIVPAQLSPQSVERTLQQHDARIRALERGQAEMVTTLSRVAEQSAKIDKLSEQQATLANQINERDKFVAWLFGLINTGAILVAGLWALMQLKRKPH